MPGIAPIAAYPLPSSSDLPTSVPEWQLDPQRAVLLIHDMQDYFLRPFADGLRDRLVRNVAALRDWCAAAGMPVAYTVQPGDMTATQRGLLADVWGPGMSAAPGDRRVVDEVVPRPGDWRLTKWRYSAFVQSDLADRLRRSGRDQLVVCGVYAHVGVLMTAADAFQQDIQPFVVADAVADFSEPYHRLALDYAAKRCAVVTTTAALVGQVPR